MASSLERLLASLSPVAPTANLGALRGKVCIAMPLGKTGPDPTTFLCWTLMALYTERAVGDVRVLASWGVPTAANRQWLAEMFHNPEEARRRVLAHTGLYTDPRWASQFVADDWEWLFWVDGDMRFEPDTLCRMLADVIERPEIRVLSGTAHKSGPSSDSVLYIRQNGKLRSLKSWPQERMFTVEAVGTFGMLMHRSVFREIAQPWIAYEVPGYGSDDAVNFCARLREAGIGIWIDPRIPFGHIDTRLISGEPAQYSEELTW